MVTRARLTPFASSSLPPENFLNRFVNLSNGCLDKWDAGERAEKAEATRSYNPKSGG